MKYKGLSIIMMLCLFVLSACTASRISDSYAFATFETECLGVEGDGSQTLRAWGKGRNKEDAVEQARKNAVRDVIFKGITSGASECNKRPLINEVNAQEKFEDYFNDFFKDGGAYMEYVSDEDARKTSQVKAVNKTQVNYGIVVRVKRSELRQRLIDDNILNP